MEHRGRFDFSRSEDGGGSTELFLSLNRKKVFIIVVILYRIMVFQIRVIREESSNSFSLAIIKTIVGTRWMELSREVVKLWAAVKLIGTKGS